MLTAPAVQELAQATEADVEADLPFPPFAAEEILPVLEPIALETAFDEFYDLEVPLAKRPRPNSFVATVSNHARIQKDDHTPASATTAARGSWSSYQHPSPVFDRLFTPHNESSKDIVEAALLQYFIEHLSRWFDLNDPARYFRVTVPKRAQTCQPLMNAILCASARHLTRIKSYQGEDGTRKYQDRFLPGLKTETALHYHYECIKALILSSSGGGNLGTEDFLAATIILRFYEEVDAPLRDEERDSELYRQMTMTFFRTRPEVSSPDYSIASPTSAAPTEYERSPTVSSVRGVQTRSSAVPTDRPHHAPYWVALRQEIHASFMHQRAFLIPIPLVSEHLQAKIENTSDIGIDMSC